MPGGRNTADRRVDEPYDSDYDEASYGERDERRSGARTPAADRRGDREAQDALAPETVVRTVLQDITELTGRQPSGVTALERGDSGGWVVEVEVVEERRIPSSGDMLATYRAQLTAAGSLTAFRRIRRYTRGKGNDEVT